MTSFISASDLTIGSAALYALVGFSVVLGVLALLVGIFYLSGYLFKNDILSREKLFGKKKKEETSTSPAAPVDEDEETVAAITAAVTLMLEDEGNDKPEFVIRRIRRK